MTEPHPNQSAATASDDAFFVLRYCREHFQRRLGELLQQCGVTSRSTIEAFTQAIGAAHDELASAIKTGGFDETAGLTASRISLVGHDELDLEIRIGDLVTHIRNNESIGHWRVQLRYMTLLDRRDMRPEQNPLGLEPISRGLWAICRESEWTLDAKLSLLDRLEEMLQLRLPEIYSELNGLLEHHRIEPAQVSVVQQRSGSRPSGGTGSNTGAMATQATGLPNALAALHQAIGQQSGGTPFQNDASAAIPFAGNAGAPAGNAVLNASAVVMLNHLMERLNALESRQTTPGTAVASDAALHAIKSKDLDLPLGSSAGIALDTLSMIFEAIFATPDLPDSVKAAIGRLQIPLLRRAILDPGFFGDAEHPARRAVNRLARAAIGLPRETRHDHPLCEHLARIADAIKTGLEAENGDISGQIEAIETLIAERDQAVAMAAAPFVRLVREHESREAASIQAQDWLKTALQTPLPIDVARFFSQYWLRVMETAHHQDNGTGERWKAYETTAKELAWSVQPKQVPDERKELLLLIPTLLRRVNAGLDFGGISPEERKPFLDACFDLQTAALRNKSDLQQFTTSPSGASATANASPPASADRPPQILEHDAVRVRYLGQYRAWRSAGTAAYKEGDWIAFQITPEERLCGRLCWQGAPYATTVFFNPVWGHAVALPPTMLDAQLRGKQAEVVSDLRLFDDAANRALGQVRPN